MYTASTKYRELRKQFSVLESVDILCNRWYSQIVKRLHARLLRLKKFKNRKKKKNFSVMRFSWYYFKNWGEEGELK